MKITRAKKSIRIMTALMLLLSSSLIFAGAFNNEAMVGKHWQVNLIGVPQDKIASMDGSNRRSIFVPLNNSGDVGRKIKIKYVIGEDFRVLDGNATDDGEAVVQVPFEYCNDYDTGCDDLVAFDVFGIALGKPFGSTLITAECAYTLAVVDAEGTAGLDCENTLRLGQISLDRQKGKPRPVDMTDLFRAEGCLDMMEADGTYSGTCEAGDLEFRNLWIFNIEQLSEYMWDYTNDGLKLLQVRFYPSVDNGYIGYVK